MRCSFCGHPPERHWLSGGCERCNCPRSLGDLVEQLAPTVTTSGTPPIQHGGQPCMYCNATETVVLCAICGAPRETT